MADSLHKFYVRRGFPVQNQNVRYYIAWICFSPDMVWPDSKENRSNVRSEGGLECAVRRYDVLRTSVERRDEHTLEPTHKLIGSHGTQTTKEDPSPTATQSAAICSVHHNDRGKTTEATAPPTAEVPSTSHAGAAAAPSAVTETTGQLPTYTQQNAETHALVQSDSFAPTRHGEANLAHWQGAGPQVPDHCLRGPVQSSISDMASYAPMPYSTPYPAYQISQPSHDMADHCATMFPYGDFCQRMPMAAGPSRGMPTHAPTMHPPFYSTTPPSQSLHLQTMADARTMMPAFQDFWAARQDGPMIAGPSQGTSLTMRGSQHGFGTAQGWPVYCYPTGPTGRGPHLSEMTSPSFFHGTAGVCNLPNVMMPPHPSGYSTVQPYAVNRSME